MKGVVAIVTLNVLLMAACGGGDNGFSPPAEAPVIPSGQFATSTVCRICHPEQYASWKISGHAFKLNRVLGAKAPTYPFSTVPSPPVATEAGPAVDWSEVSYVIGGYKWKARFINLDGFIWEGPDVQYNLATRGFSRYNSDTRQQTKPYNCGKCHTTGWVPFDEGGKRQNDMPGMDGAFAEAGIACEACHGRGDSHVNVMRESAGSEPEAKFIIREDSLVTCLGCHSRDAQHRIEAKGGLIRHHEQYDEFITSAKADGAGADLTCNSCHDPHVTTVYRQRTTLDGTKQAGDGLVRKCVDCHTDIPVRVTMRGVACEDCHMPRIVKSAVGSTLSNGLSLGDIRSHIFKIDVNTVSAEALFSEDPADGKTVANASGAGIPLAYACRNCHGAGDGRATSDPTDDALLAVAPLIHMP